MKRRKTIEIKEALAVIDRHIETRKRLAKHIKSDRENLKRHGIFEKKTKQSQARAPSAWVGPD